MKTYTSYLLILFTIFFATSCKKYPEGGEGLASVSGQWGVTYFGINGYDSTQYLKSQPFYGNYEFYKETNGGNKIGIYNCLTPNPSFGCSYSLNGHWMLMNNDKSLFIHFNNYSCVGSIGPYRANDVTWEIRRLKRNELWIKTNYNNKEYFVKFKHKSR